MQNIINVNGQIIPSEEANVSVFDRSFLYGDSLYEVVRTYRGQPFRLKDHLQRLFESGQLCQMPYSQSIELFEKEILRSIALFYEKNGPNAGEVYARIVVTRGSGPIGFSVKNVKTPTTFVIYVEPLKLFPNPDFERGAHLHISDRIRNHPKALDSAMKSGNYLNSLLAYLSAADQGFDDALMVDGQGFLTEGTTFNVFYVKRGIVATPPLDIGILDGITRRIIIQLCIENNIPCREVRFPADYLADADEAFLSSSIKEVFPLTFLNGKKIANGKPGPITRQLKAAFDHAIAQELKLK
jgi:branched-chain amino acid aminotransferase